jgi:hypothetical protein
MALSQYDYFAISDKLKSKIKLSKCREICKLRNEILHEKNVDKSRQRHRQKKYLKKRRKAFLHVMILLEGDMLWNVISFKNEWYSKNHDKHPPYITSNIIRDIRDVLKNTGRIEWKRGNKKFTPHGMRKWQASPQEKYLSHEKRHEMYLTPGFTTEMRLKRSEDIFSALSLIQAKNKITGKKEFLGNASSMSQDMLNHTNSLFKKWGLHVDGRKLEYYQRFADREGLNGRLYSIVTQMSREERDSVFESNFVEIDQSGSLPQILTMAETGQRFKSDSGNEDVYNAISDTLNLPHKEYRFIMKRAMLVCLNADPDVALKSLRKTLATTGQRFTPSRLSGLSIKQAETILNNLPAHRGDFRSGIKARILLSGLLKNKKQEEIDETVENLNRARNLCVKFRSKNDIDPYSYQYLLSEDEIIQATVDTHQQISKYFFNREIGLTLCFIEQFALQLTLDEMDKNGIWGYSVHDAIYAPSKFNKSIHSLFSKSIVYSVFLLRYLLFSILSPKNQCNNNPLFSSNNNSIITVQDSGEGSKGIDCNRVREDTERIRA